MERPLEPILSTNFKDIFMVNILTSKEAQLFVYAKTDDEETKTGRLNVKHTVFVEANKTADFQTTRGINKILENDGNTEDLVAFMRDRNLPMDYEIEALRIAEELLGNPPEIGYLTISNALQWRLQYSRVVEKAGEINGINKIL